MIVSLVAPSVNPSPVCLSWNEIWNNMQIQAPINIVTRANFQLGIYLLIHISYLRLEITDIVLVQI